MPRICLDSTSKKENILYTFLNGTDLTQQQIADALGITQQGVSKKKINKSFTVRDWITILDLLNPDEETLLILINSIRGIKCKAKN